MRGRRGAAVIAFPGLAVLVAFAATGNSIPRPPPAPASHSAASGLTLRQLVGERLAVSWQGANPPAGLRRRIANGDVAGVIVFRGNIPSRAYLRRTLKSLQAIRRPPGLRAPLLVMVDQEGGLVKRLSGPPNHSPAALGRIGSASLARREGAGTAANLRSVGISVDLAPVLDVGRPGTFQAQTLRSYSRHAGVAARLGSAFVSGLQSHRTAATLKHFPGLGTIKVNEDDVAQRIDLPLRTLRAVDERPFVAASRAGARLVMTSTAIYPALSRRIPALLSHRIVGQELRRHVGFDGVIVTDDITTRGLVRFGPPGRLAVRAANAGNDLILMGASYHTEALISDAVLRAAREGRISRASLEASAERVLQLRKDLAAGQP